MSSLPGAVAVGALVVVASVASRATWVRVAHTPRVPRGDRTRSAFDRVRRRWRLDQLRGERGDLGVLVDAAARAAAGGAALVPALTVGADAAGPPFVDAVGRLRRRLQSGQPLDAALARWAADEGDPDTALLVATCRLGAQLGRGTAAALDGVADGLRQQRAQRDELAVATSSATASAVLLCCLPAVVVVVFSVVDARAVRWLLLTPPGWVCAACAVGLDLAGGWWMRHLIRGAA